MQFTPLVEHALNTASDLHREHTRKDGETPYLVHLVAVAWMVADHTDDENMVAAALLHDVLEDVSGYGAERMRAEFGDAITELVLGVTEPKDPNAPKEGQPAWRERKERYLENLRGAPDGAVLISLADKIHNTRSILAMAENGELDRSAFGSSMEERRWFTDGVAAIGRERLGGHPLVVELERLTERAAKEL